MENTTSILFFSVLFNVYLKGIVGPIWGQKLPSGLPSKFRVPRTGVILCCPIWNVGTTDNSLAATQCTSSRTSLSIGKSWRHFYSDPETNKITYSHHCYSTHSWKFQSDYQAKNGNKRDMYWQHDSQTTSLCR